MSQVQIQRSDVALYVPATLLVGVMFYNSADKKLYVGSSLNLPVLVADNPDDISMRLATLEASPSGSNATSVQALAPNTPTAGDLWFNTTTANLMVWTGTEWTYAVNIANNLATGVYPVSTNEFFEHIVYTTDDAADIELATRLIASATAFAESYTGRFFIIRNVTQRYDSFPSLVSNAKQPLVVKGGIVNSIDSITYYDSAYSTQTLTASGYRLIDKNGKSRVYPAMGEQWPTDVATGEPDVITITYEIGSLPADVPAPIRSAILLIAASLWEHRENEIVGTNIKSLKPVIAAKDLLHPYKLR